MSRAAHARMWRQQFRRGSGFRFAVAVLGGTIVGHTSLHRAYSTFASAAVVTVEDLFVIPAARGRGVGAALLRFAEAHARRLQAARLELHVRPDNRARDLYRRAGFRPTRYEWWKKPLDR